MQRYVNEELETLKSYFEQAAAIARQATCHRAKCGTVIVKDNVILGKGYNGPALADENNRVCEFNIDVSKKPKYDKTCCVHAEWRAILDACKNHGDAVTGAMLIFMRIDNAGNFTDADTPYCTVCSRLTLEAGISTFALWNNDGADVYDAAEYNTKSYEFYAN